MRACDRAAHCRYVTRYRTLYYNLKNGYITGAKQQRGYKENIGDESDVESGIVGAATYFPRYAKQNLRNA